MPTDLALLALAAIVGPIVSYLLGRRSASGTVNVTEASALWLEAREIREADHERIRELEETLKRERREQQAMRHDLRSQLFACELERNHLRRQLDL